MMWKAVFVSAVCLATSALVMLPSGGDLRAQTAFAESDAETADKDKAPPPAASDILRIATWGGSYMKAMRQTIFAPFSEKSGIEIKAVMHTAAHGLLDTSVDQTAFDLVDIDGRWLDEACRAGFLEKIDPENLAPGTNNRSGRRSVKADFLSGALQPCGVASNAYSSLILWRPAAFKKRRRPTRLAHFFDVRRYRGKRALPDRPQYVLELALMAAGVRPRDVYQELATDEGALKAFRQLDRIKRATIWWRKGAEPVQLLVKGKVAMALSFNGQAFVARTKTHKHLNMIWDRAIYRFDYWAIPKAAPHKALARQFLQFATRADVMAAQASLFPYGPVRLSARRLITRHPLARIDMKPYLPTTARHMKTALRFDPVFWNKQEDRLTVMFRNWRAGRKILPEAKPEPEAPAPAVDPAPGSDTGSGQDRPKTRPAAADQKPPEKAASTSQPTTTGVQ